MRQGIPTEYTGIRFRSRLEAQWAAFFDLLGYKWQYEPLDLSGYIPDFILTGKNRPGAINQFHNVLIEVKPETSLPSLCAHFDKIINSGWEDDAVVVGCGPMVDEFGGACLGKGIIYYPVESGEWHFEFKNGFDPDCDTDTGVKFFKCCGCGRITFDPWCNSNCHLCGESNDFPNPNINKFPGDDGVLDFVDPELIHSLWNAAKNRVQWKGEFGA